jgi:hypothetical protein
VYWELLKKLIDKPHHGNFWPKSLEKVGAENKLKLHWKRLQDTPDICKMSSMITAAQWVPRGFAAQFPQVYKLDESEFDRIASLAKLQLDDAEEDLKEAQEEGEDVEEGDEHNDEEMEGEGDEENKAAAPVKYVSWVFVKYYGPFANKLTQDRR